MAERFDAVARLAQGRPVVADLQAYVWACHLVGYQNPDLTLHPSHVDDWYGSEDGLDLRALDADCRALRAAADATEDADRRCHRVDQRKPELGVAVKRLVAQEFAVLVATHFGLAILSAF